MILLLMSCRTCAALTDPGCGIIDHRTVRDKDALHETIAGIERDGLIRRIHFRRDMAFIVRVVIKIQLCYPIGFLSDSSGAFAL